MSVHGLLLYVSKWTAGQFGASRRSYIAARHATDRNFFEVGSITELIRRKDQLLKSGSFPSVAGLACWRFEAHAHAVARTSLHSRLLQLRYVHQHRMRCRAAPHCAATRRTTVRPKNQTDTSLCTWSDLHMTRIVTSNN